MYPCVQSVFYSHLPYLRLDPYLSLLQEDILPHLILQVVVKEENKDAQWAKDIVAAYHSDEFKEYLDKNNNGLWFVPEELFN